MSVCLSVWAVPGKFFQALPVILLLLAAAARIPMFLRKNIAAGAAIPDSHREPRKCGNLFSPPPPRCYCADSWRDLSVNDFLNVFLRCDLEFVAPFMRALNKMTEPTNRRCIGIFCNSNAFCCKEFKFCWKVMISSKKWRWRRKSKLQNLSM